MATPLPFISQEDVIAVGAMEQLDYLRVQCFQRHSRFKTSCASGDTSAFRQQPSTIAASISCGASLIQPGFEPESQL
jgi:hypothetical protein